MRQTVRPALLKFGFLWFALGPGGPSHADPVTIDLKTEAGSFGGLRVTVDVGLAGTLRTFYLDTAAGTTRVRRDELTSAFPLVGEASSDGAYGAGSGCALVTAPWIGVRGFVRRDAPLKRCDQAETDIDNLGFDVLARQRFALRTRAKQLVIEAPEVAAAQLPLFRHKYEIVIPVATPTGATYALFDTGASVTIVDKKFVAAHSADFEFTGTSSHSVDINGRSRDIAIVKIAHLNLGNREVKDVYAGVGDLSYLQSILGETITVILGNNVIFRADWSFDLVRALWGVEPH